MAVRLFIRVALDIARNPKLLGAGSDPKWLHVVAQTVAAREQSDGVIRPAVAYAEAEVSPRAGKRLLERGLWHQPGHDCARCPQPPAGQVVIHDYLDHQESRADIEARAEKKSRAGRKGAASRWGDSRHGTSDSSRHGTPIAEVEGEVEGEDLVVQPVGQSPSAARALDRLTDDDLEQIRQAVGGTSSADARRVAETVLGKTTQPVAAPGRYVLAAVRENPGAYRCARRTSRKADECPDHPGQPAHNCGGCAVEARVGDR